MNKLLDLLKTMLFPINGSDNSFALQPSKKREGFVARGINPDTLDISALQALLPTVKPGWQVTHFEPSESFDPKTGKKVLSPEMLYFGPSIQQDESQEILDLFG